MPSSVSAVSTNIFCLGKCGSEALHTSRSRSLVNRTRVSRVGRTNSRATGRKVASLGGYWLPVEGANGDLTLRPESRRIRPAVIPHARRVSGGRTPHRSGRASHRSRGAPRGRTGAAQSRETDCRAGSGPNPQAIVVRRERPRSHSQRPGSHRAVAAHCPAAHSRVRSGNRAEVLVREAAQGESLHRGAARRAEIGVGA